jgi:hypothetical protein
VYTLVSGHAQQIFFTLGLSSASGMLDVAPGVS